MPELFEFSSHPLPPSPIYISTFPFLFPPIFVPSKEIPSSLAQEALHFHSSQTQCSLTLSFIPPVFFMLLNPPNICKCAWVFAICGHSPDVGFLSRCSAEALEEPSVPASLFLAPSHFLVPYTHSFTNYILSCLPCSRHCARYWGMTGKEHTKIPALTSLPSNREDRSQTR